ncbi:MAG: fumarylacetoacetate hydrolase family protein [Acidobacteria bacterium]|nr:fumarylacetoacetate hydrolase family protein [Acidobacteriota bacterium]
MNTLFKLASYILAAVLFTPACFATKLVTYSFRGETRLGASVDGNIIDLNRAYSFLLKERGKERAEAFAAALVPPDMMEFLQGQEDSRNAALEAIRFVQDLARSPHGLEWLKRSGIWFTNDEVKLMAPLPNPPHVLAIGLNYRAHIEEVNTGTPGQPASNLAPAPYPIVFTKEGRVIGPGEPIRIPAQVQQPDYEGELAVVIGKPARNVSRGHALEYVAGYTNFNDVTSRDFQNRVSQWTLGKSPDTFSVMGPFLVLTDEVPNPQTLRIRTRIGNETLQDSITERMIFPVSVLIEYISQVMTLETGTVIATGTPEGVGMARTPPRWLKPGETVVVEIEKLGELANPIQKE